MKLDSDVLDILNDSRLQNERLVLPDQLPRELYVKVNKAIELLGGKWSRSAKAHIFPVTFNLREALSQACETGIVVDDKKEYQFFPTPPDLARDMVRAAELDSSFTILEPSAGSGAILEAISEIVRVGHRVTTVELHPGRHEELKWDYPSANHIQGDFLAWAKTCGQKFDRIVANPPFSGGQDVDHVTAMFELLQPGGRLVSITAPGFTFRDDKRHTAFRELISKHGHHSPVPEGTFSQSGTEIRTEMVILNKPGKVKQLPIPEEEPPAPPVEAPKKERAATMQKTQINPLIAHELFACATNAAEKGQSQFFTPVSFGQHAAKALTQCRQYIVDIQCGQGHLLQASALPGTEELLGADIDPCEGKPHGDLKTVKDPRRLNRIVSDFCKLQSMLEDLNFSAPVWVLNPPWRLYLKRDLLQNLAESKSYYVKMAYECHEPHIPRDTIDSTIASIMVAINLMPLKGEGMCIANHNTIQRLIFAEDAPHAHLAKHCWGRAIAEGNPMTGTDNNTYGDQTTGDAAIPSTAENGQSQSDDQLDNMGGRTSAKTEVLYFASSHFTGVRKENITQWPALPDRVWRTGAQPRDHDSYKNEYESWSTVREHIRQQRGEIQNNHPFNLYLVNDTIQVHLSRYEDRSRRIDKTEAKRLLALQGKKPIQLVIERAARQELLHVCDAGGWRVSPDLREAIAKSLSEYNSNRAPLYPLDEIKRLGHLEEQDFITCKQDLWDSDILPDPNPPKTETKPTPKTLAARLQSSRFAILPDAVEDDDATVGRVPPHGAGATAIPVKLFQAGKSYHIRTATVPVVRHKTRPNSYTGVNEKMEYLGQELATYIAAENGLEYSFMEGNLKKDKSTKIPEKRGLVDGKPGRPPARPANSAHPIDFSLQTLCKNFVIPEVPDIAEARADQFAENIKRIRALEAITEEITALEKDQQSQAA